jgi:hypothetical protein
MKKEAEQKKAENGEQEVPIDFGIVPKDAE